MTPVRVTAPAYYKIAGVPSAVVTSSTDYLYLLLSAGQVVVQEVKLCQNNNS